MDTVGSANELLKVKKPRSGLLPSFHSSSRPDLGFFSPRPDLFPFISVRSTSLIEALRLILTPRLRNRKVTLRYTFLFRSLYVVNKNCFSNIVGISAIFETTRNLCELLLHPFHLFLIPIKLPPIFLVKVWSVILSPITT